MHTPLMKSRIRSSVWVIILVYRKLVKLGSYLFIGRNMYISETSKKVFKSTSPVVYLYFQMRRDGSTQLCDCVIAYSYLPSCIRQQVEPITKLNAESLEKRPDSEENIHEKKPFFMLLVSTSCWAYIEKLPSLRKFHNQNLCSNLRGVFSFNKMVFSQTTLTMVSVKPFLDNHNLLGNNLRIWVDKHLAATTSSSCEVVIVWLWRDRFTNVPIS